MSSNPQWNSETGQQAEYLDNFKKSAADELASIKSRLGWFLLPTFVMLLAVLGFYAVTWFQLQEVQADFARLKNIEDTLNKTNRDAKAKRPVFLENGFTSAERSEFYHLAEGSEVFPLDWLEAMKNSKSGNMFVDDLPSMGFLRDWDDTYKDGLPIVGLTADTARGLEPLGKMVGLNCAACHVGEMSYNGQRVRIDGAPNFLNTRLFFASLVDSALTTAKDPEELLAFASRLKEERADVKQAAAPKVRSAARALLGKWLEAGEKDLKAAVVPIVKKLSDMEKDSPRFDLAGTVNGVKTDAKELRQRLLKNSDLDKLKGLLEKNTLVKKALEELADKADQDGTLLHTLEELYINIRLLRARAEFLQRLAPVGADERTDWGPGRVDAFGSARAFLFQYGQNGTKPYLPVNPVSYPFVWGLYRIDWFHYDNNTTSILQRNFGQALGVGAVYDPKTLSSSLRPANLYRLESLATKLTPPKWPAEIFGPIDEKSAERGKIHYVQLCSKCHDAPKDKEMFKDTLFVVKALGVDPLRAEMFAEKLPSGEPFADAIGGAMEKIMQKSLDDNNVSAADRAKFAKPPIEGRGPVKVEWRGPGKYAARPLDGVWASGPFLHNGSVPTIDDLLQPDKRPAKFYVGYREFDPARLGYISVMDNTEPNYDTTKPGNSNKGHEYGSKLKDDERKDLLEYLKAL